MKYIVNFIGCMIIFTFMDIVCFYMDYDQFLLGINLSTFLSNIVLSILISLLTASSK